MAGLFIPALPFLIGAVLIGIAGLVLYRRQRREISKTAVMWTTITLTLALAAVGAYVVLSDQLGSITEIGR